MILSKLSIHQYQTRRIRILRPRLRANHSLIYIPSPDGTLDHDYARITKHFLLLFSTSIDELGRRAAESGRAALGNEQSVEINDGESMDEDTSPQGDVQVKGKFIRTLLGMLQYNVEAEPTEWLWRLQCAHKLLKEEDSRAFIFDPDVSRDAFFSIVYREPDLLVSKDLEGTDIVRAEACREVSSILSKQSVSEVEEIMNAKGCYPFPVRSSGSSDISLQKSGAGKTFGSRKCGDRSSSSGPLKKSRMMNQMVSMLNFMWDLLGTTQPQMATETPRLPHSRKS